MSLLCTSLLLSGIDGVLHDCFLVAGVYVRLMKINSVCIAAVLFSILNHSLFEPRHAKTVFLHMRKQRRRSASR